MPTILSMKAISKTFPGVRALDNVSFNVEEGEVHCLIGENGAGKSTLMKVLSGVHPYGSYSGSINIFNTEQQFKTINDSEKAGIGIIYQELALVPEMTVYENIYLGHEKTRRGVINWNETIQASNKMLKIVGLSIEHSDVRIKDLGVGKQQLVEIAKVLSRDVKILILDEPTAALNEQDCDNLLNLIIDLKSRGVTCIMISHKLKEVIRIADKVTVLRDGKTICSLVAEKKEISEEVLIKHMVGREINNIYPQRSHSISEEVVLETRSWSAQEAQTNKTVLNDISIQLRKGEIVGIAGLVGSGRTEFARSIFGNPDKYKVSGEVSIGAQAKTLDHPAKAIRSGMAYVSEDRKQNGLILIQNIKQNITVAGLKKVSKRSIINNNQEIVQAQNFVTSMNVKTPSIEQLVGKLSGGNQQKVQLSKWLFVNPEILILDEPTRGIDVGAKHEIYQIMNKLVEEGMSIIMISSELPEILGMSDRIYVVSGGRISGELETSEADQEKILAMATN